MPFLVFWEDNFCLKCSLNQLSFYAYFLFAWFRVQVLDFILYYFVQFLKFSGHQFLLSIIFYVFLYKYRKSSFGNVKIGIFSYPDHILVGIQDFQAKLGESRWKSGWTVGKKINLTMKILYRGSFNSYTSSNNITYAINSL